MIIIDIGSLRLTLPSKVGLPRPTDKKLTLKTDFKCIFLVTHIHGIHWLLFPRPALTVTKAAPSVTTGNPLAPSSLIVGVSLPRCGIFNWITDCLVLCVKLSCQPVLWLRYVLPNIRECMGSHSFLCRLLVKFPRLFDPLPVARLKVVFPWFYALHIHFPISWCSVWLAPPIPDLKRLLSWMVHLLCGNWLAQ